MRKVFSSNEVSETALVRDALVHHGVAVIIQNEYSGRSAVPGFRPPAEVWVRRDDDYENARRVVIDTITTLHSKSDTKPWVCSNCEQENPQSFDICWNCGRDKSNSNDRA
jgi:putative signal transducing protein